MIERRRLARGRIRLAAAAVIDRLDIPDPLRADVVEQTHELLRRLEAVEDHDDVIADYDTRRDGE